MRITKEQFKRGQIAWLFGSLVIFLMNWVVYTTTPSVTWDYALVRAAEFTFWHGLLVPGLISYAAYRIINHYNR